LYIVGLLIAGSQLGSQRTRRSGPLANKVEKIDRRQVWACPSVTPLVLFSLGGRSTSPHNIWFIGPLRVRNPKRHLDQFSCFITARNARDPSDRHRQTARPPLASTPPGMPGTHPNILVGGTSTGISPQYYYVLSDIADQYWLPSVRSASSRFHSAIRRHQFASVRQADSRLTRLVPPNLELALTPLQTTLDL